MHATMMGHTAVEAVKSGEVNKAVVYQHGQHVLIDLNDAITMERKYDPKMYEITKIMAI
jgi:hypothetical protein